MTEIIENLKNLEDTYAQEFLLVHPVERLAHHIRVYLENPEVYRAIRERGSSAVPAVDEYLSQSQPR